MNRFEQLRREAYSRGRRDAAREIAEFERLKRMNEPTPGIWCNNPHQNNHATDEKQQWLEGFADEMFETYGAAQPVLARNV